jgi:hypothetical protein
MLRTEVLRRGLQPRLHGDGPDLGHGRLQLSARHKVEHQAARRWIVGSTAQLFSPNLS